MKPRMIWLLVPLLMAFLTTGCETTKGFGRDVQKLGSSIQRAVD
ncbi:MAG: entericidin A/B family lipoprotein [Plesiomonas sp.]